ncbi:MAG: hypothetical protein M1515_01065 [Candidatus Thermoplasmatota archaeon]|nr:hypothetical protein [Candidatus Thermoplasmatota archaeon]
MDIEKIRNVILSVNIRIVLFSLFLTIVLDLIYIRIIRNVSFLDYVIIEIVTFMALDLLISSLGKRGYFSYLSRNTSLVKRSIRCASRKEKRAMDAKIEGFLRKEGMDSKIFGTIQMATEIHRFDPPLRENDSHFLVSLENLGYERNEMTERYSDSNDDSRDHITSLDFQNFKKREDVVLEDNSTIWVTGIRVMEGDENSQGKKLVLRYAETGYYRKYSLNRLLHCKFPWEPRYPIEHIIDNLESIKGKDFTFLRGLPSGLGCEVSVITSDGKYIIVQRSHKEAVARFKLIQASSGAYDLEDFYSSEGKINENENHVSSLFRGARRELEFETGIITKYGGTNFSGTQDSMLLLSAYYFVDINAVNFIFLYKTSLTFEQFKEKFRKEQSKEKWESRRILSLDIRDIISDSPEFENFMIKHRNILSDQLIVSIYSLKEYYGSINRANGLSRRAEGH